MASRAAGRTVGRAGGVSSSSSNILFILEVMLRRNRRVQREMPFKSGSSWQLGARLEERKGKLAKDGLLFAAAVNAQTCSRTICFFTISPSFPNVQITQPKLPQAGGGGERPAPTGREGGSGEIFHLVHLFSPIAGWVGIGWSVVGRSVVRAAVSQFFLSKQPSALQQQQLLPPLCLQFMRWNKIGKCVGEKDRARWDKNRNSRRDGGPSSASGRVSGQHLCTKNVVR